MFSAKDTILALLPHTLVFKRQSCRVGITCVKLDIDKFKERCQYFCRVFLDDEKHLISDSINIWKASLPRDVSYFWLASSHPTYPSSSVWGQWREIQMRVVHFIPSIFYICDISVFQSFHVFIFRNFIDFFPAFKNGTISKYFKI